MLQKTHPMIIVAAIAVTIASAVGIGVMTGVIPSAGGNNATSSPASTGMPPSITSTGAALGAAGSAPDAEPTDAKSTTPAPSLKPIDKPTLGQPLAKNDVPIGKRPTTAAAPATPTKAPAYNATNAPTPSYAGSTQTTDGKVVTSAKSNDPVVNCPDCGTIDSIVPVTEKRQGSGAGAVIGGVVGGVLGHQVGSGRGKDVATVAGVVGGAVLGNTIEKSNKSTLHVEIRVRLGDGTFRTLKSDSDQGLRVGDKVRIDNGRVNRNP